MPKIACDGLKSNEKGRKKEPSGLKSSRGKKVLKLFIYAYNNAKGEVVMGKSAKRVTQ